MVQKLVLHLQPRMDDLIEYNFIDTEILDFNPEFFGLWISDVITDNGFTLQELSYVFCTDDYLLDMNKQYLQHDYFTDVITFNYNEDISLSGDVFISYDRVKDNAKLLGVSKFDELCRVMVHGVLHLCGFNDKTKEEELEMREMEDKYLNKRNSFT